MDLSYNKKKADNKNLFSFLSFLQDLNIRRPGAFVKNSYEFRNFNGDERNRIFQNINLKTIFPTMIDVELKQIVWDDFYRIIFDIKDDLKDIDVLKLRIENFLKNFLDISFKKSITPYTHILVSHIYQQTKSLKTKNLCINDFSMQGIEKLNDFVTKYFQRSSNKKGEFIKQVLQKRSRIEILHHHDNLLGILDL